MLKLLILNLLVLVFANDAARKCSNVKIRKEFRELSLQEQESFYRGVNLLKRAPSKDGQLNRYDDYVAMHLAYTEYAHNIPAFLPWHRQFIINFERDLQGVLNDPKFMLPYWRWEFDSQAPERSFLMQSNSFGTNGNRRNPCIVDGKFANWIAQDGGCLYRGGSKRIDPWYSPEQIEWIIYNSGDYEDFRDNFEQTAHVAIHLNIGGLMSTQASPDDPLFFVHHSNIDRIWYQYQARGPAYQQSYPDWNEILYPHNVRVYSLMFADSPELCYTYTGIVYGEQRISLFHANITVQESDLDPLDRQDMNRLRIPKPMNPEFASMMGYNLTRVRELEAKLAKVNIEANALISQGLYESLASLESRKQT